MGKTYFAKMLQEILPQAVANYEYQEVSNDRIKKQI